MHSSNGGSFKRWFICTGGTGRKFLITILFFLTKNDTYFTRWRNLLFGSEQEFGMDNRLYNVASFAVFALMIVFFIIYTAMGVHGARILLLLLVFIIEGLFYYWSRFKKKYEKSLVVNGLISYAVLIANYFVNDGIEGPTIFFFFLTLHLLVCSTGARLHVLWLVLHVLTVTALLLLELYWPLAVVHSYATPLTRTLDIFMCSVAAILLMYITLLQLRNYYKSEKRASESQQIKLNAFFESSDKIHILLNAQKSILYFNKAAAQFIGKEYSTGIKIGSNITSYLKPAYVPRFNSNFEAALSGKTVTEENMLDYNMLGRVWWQNSFLPVKGDDGHIAGVSFNAENITSRKLKEEKIHAKNQSLLAIAKKQATELREPAAAVIGLMALACEDEGRLQEYLALMEAAASKLDRKIQEIVAQTNDASKEAEDKR